MAHQLCEALEGEGLQAPVAAGQGGEGEEAIRQLGVPILELR